MNTDKVTKRLKTLTGAASDKELAKLLGITSQNFSNRKNRGTLLPVITEWAIGHDVDLNWLLRGEAGITQEHEKCFPVTECLLDINEWLALEIKKNKKAEDWFDFQFCKLFPEFNNWRSKRDQQV